MKWEYQVAEMYLASGADARFNRENTLKAFGRDGWELVAVVAESGYHVMYLKKPLPEATDASEAA